METEKFFAGLGNGSGEGFPSATPAEGTPPESSDVDMLVPIVVYSILFAVGAAGNLSVFVSLFRAKRKSRVVTLLLHLTTADLIVTFFMIPMEIMWRITNEWRAGNLMCKVFMGIRAFGPYLSSNILVCISLDRYFVILYPLRIGSAFKRGKTMLTFAWIFSAACSFPQVVVFRVRQHPLDPDFHQCVTFGSFSSEIQETLYNLFCIAAIYLVPLSVIVFSYSSILWEVSIRSKETKEGSNGIFVREKDKERIRLRKSNLTSIARAKSRTLKMTVTIVVAFIWCWTPYVVMTLWYMFDRNTAKDVNKQLQEILFVMAVSNSCVNPLVYGSYALEGKRRLWCFGLFNFRGRERSTIKKSLLNSRTSRSVQLSISRLNLRGWRSLNSEYRFARPFLSRYRMKTENILLTSPGSSERLTTRGRGGRSGTCRSGSEPAKPEDVKAPSEE